MTSEINLKRIKRDIMGWVAAKIVRSKEYGIQCWYITDKLEPCKKFDILTGSSDEYKWVLTSNGMLPDNAIVTNGDLGIGRWEAIPNAMSVGYVVPIHDGVYLAYRITNDNIKGMVKSSQHEVLVEIKKKCD
jgi:hypothetical protein